ncbi:hypothetical protein BJY01DRAFT_213488 [Aspergillus pseudoustus]|uniref:Transmembrane protein n=1 Tax=Aspergillus pseudoustus TaxID=1810923 RepID=A0ABR4K586_9EURO
MSTSYPAASSLSPKMANCHCDCNCPPFSHFQPPSDPAVPHFPPHVVTPTFWFLTALILLHTLLIYSAKLAHGSYTSWLHDSITTPLRKKLAVAVYVLILGISLHEGFYILKTDWALWCMLVDDPPAAVPYKENLADWVDWTNGVVASSIPIAVTLGLGVWILVTLCGCLTELVGVQVQQGGSVVLQEKDEDLLD